MTKPAPIRRPRPSKSEEGYILVVVIFMLALLTIALAVALPKVAKEIQRDRELETMHRGKQYIRGVRMYYKKFNAYPASVDALVKPTNNIRFLRKKYKDPTTGKEDWKPVRFGQNKAPTAMGFFGQPIGGVGGCPVNPLGTTTSQGGLSSGGIGSAPSPSTGNSPNCPVIGLNPSSDTATPTGGPPPTSGTPPTNPTTASSTSGQPGQPGQTGMTVGGGPIIGFTPNSPKKSILVYKTKNHYNEWEFVYDPIVEQQMIPGGGPTGLTPTTTTPTTTTPTTTTRTTTTPTTP